MAGRFSIEAIFKAVDRLTRPVAQMASRVSKFAGMAGGAVKQLTPMADKFGGTFAGAATAVGAGAIAAGVGLAALAKPGADFEEAMAAVGAVSLMTRDQVADLEKKALELGSTTRFSATEVAQGMELMGRAGFTNAEVMSSIGGVLSAAAAEGAGLAETTSIVSNTLKGMGLATVDAVTGVNNVTRVADVLALASARTNSSITSLGESMKNIAPVARQFNIPLEQAVASVALLQDVGIDASEAGTATATMLTKLAQPADEVAAKMRQLGIAFKDAKGNALTLPQILGNFDKAAKKSGGSMEVISFFADLVGLRGQKAALNLKEAFASGKFGDLIKELELAAGTSERMAKLRLDSLKGDFTLLHSAVDGLLVSLFSMESGPLRGVVQGFTAWVTANKGLIQQKVADTVKAIADNLPTIVFWLKTIGTVVAVLGTFALGVKAASLAMGAFNAVVALNPIGLIVLAVAAAATGIALLIVHAKEVRQFFLDLWDTIKKNPITSLVIAIAALPLLFAVAIPAAVALVIAFWDDIKRITAPAIEFLETVFGFVKDAFMAEFEFMIGIAVFTWEAIKTIFGPVVSFFTPMFRDVGALVAFVFRDMVAAAKIAFKLFMAVWQPIAKFFSGLWDGIVETFMRVLGPIFNAIKAAIDHVRNLGRDALDPPPLPSPSGNGGGGGTDPGRPSASPPPILSPQERLAQAIAGDNAGGHHTGEILIRDQSGRASIAKDPKFPNFDLRLVPSGGF